MSGWGLTGRLISKHFSVLGDKVAEAIASFDPETATEADRDRQQATLQQVAQELAVARTSFGKEHKDVEDLRQMIANDEKVAEQLAERLVAGTISESSVTMFCDELETNKAKLPQELQEEADAKQFMDEIQQIVDGMSKQLAEFDAAAKRAKQTLASAQAQKNLQQMRLDRQEEINGLNGLKKNSSALSALTKKAEKLSNQAEGMKIVADIQQKPIDQKKELDAIRASIAQGSQAESLAQRLARLSGKTEAAA